MSSDHAKHCMKQSFKLAAQQNKAANKHHRPSTGAGPTALQTAGVEGTRSDLCWENATWTSFLPVRSHAPWPPRSHRHSWYIVVPVVQLKTGHSDCASAAQLHSQRHTWSVLIPLFFHSCFYFSCDSLSESMELLLAVLQVQLCSFIFTS